MKKQKLIGVNEAGRRVGQYHPAARLTDRDVELMRQMHEQYARGHSRHWSYGQIAKKFEVPKSTVQHICSYRYRVEAAIYKVVSVTRK